jgi:hypothetical protein
MYVLNGYTYRVEYIVDGYTYIVEYKYVLNDVNIYVSMYVVSKVWYVCSRWVYI